MITFLGDDIRPTRKNNTFSYRKHIFLFLHHAKKSYKIRSEQNCPSHTSSLDDAGKANKIFAFAATVMSKTSSLKLSVFRKDVIFSDHSTIDSNELNSIILGRKACRYTMIHYEIFAKIFSRHLSVCLMSGSNRSKNQND